MNERCETFCDCRKFDNDLCKHVEINDENVVPCRNEQAIDQGNHGGVIDDNVHGRLSYDEVGKGEKNEVLIGRTTPILCPGEVLRVMRLDN